MFLEESHIPLNLTNVSHTPTPLKESSHITLTTCISKENNHTAHPDRTTRTWIYTGGDLLSTKQTNLNDSTIARN